MVAAPAVAAGLIDPEPELPREFYEDLFSMIAKSDAENYPVLVVDVPPWDPEQQPLLPGSIQYVGNGDRVRIVNVPIVNVRRALWTRR